MGWASAIKERAVVEAQSTPALNVPAEKIDWPRLVTLDFETYYASDYTLKKMSTSEFVRDPRFKAQMVGIKIGRRATKLYTAKTLKAALKAIDWTTHSLLCHNTMFDGFVLSHHYGIKPKRYYDTFSMARGLHSNEIGAGLDEVAKFYGGEGKIEGILDATKGVLDWTPNMVKHVGPYCARDVDECFRVFTEMVRVFPAKEMDLIHMTIRMFCAPVLRVDIPRVQAEYEREVTRRKLLLLETLSLTEEEAEATLKTKAERALTGEAREMLIAKRTFGSNEKFANLLRAEGVQPPVKISPAWIKNGKPDDGTKWSYAFAKDDLDFVDLPDRVFDEVATLDRDQPDDVAKAAAISERLQRLVDARIATKSTTNITRAQRFLVAGANGMALPVGYRYFGAGTGRWAGANSMNMQNLTRGGELRLSILAQKGYSLAVVDSGQIEARVNAWLWGQEDLLEAFRDADAGTGRDAYCRFADNVYGREITKKDADERFLGKVCVLGLGYQMGAAKFQMTLAKGALGGPRVNFPLHQCQGIVTTYRRLNHAIVNGWEFCKRIIADMAAWRSGHYKCLRWGPGFIQLPNGMYLKYPDLRQAKNENGWDEWTYAAKDVRKKIYGGLLCENLVQALARIIVGEQMLMIDEKYPIVMTTHDEAVAHVRTSQADKCFALMTQAFRTPLSWCPDLPLFSEGGHALNYSK